MENHEKSRIIIRLFRLSCLLAFAAAAFSCASRRSEPALQKTFSVSGVAREGERVYAMYCYRCHPAGEAGLGPSINANPFPMSFKKLQVRHGLGVMPAFDKKTISPEELRALGVYLTAWKRY